MIIKKGAILMMDLWFNHVKSYTQDILAENADNLKQFEIRPGVYSNVDPADLRDVKAADFDLLDKN